MLKYVLLSILFKKYMYEFTSKYTEYVKYTKVLRFSRYKYMLSCLGCLSALSVVVYDYGHTYGAHCSSLTDPSV